MAQDAAVTFINEGSELEGKGSFAGAVMLNGRFTGDLQANGAIIVGSTAVVRAQIRAPAVVIEGEVVGDVIVTERIELRGRARVVGDLEAPILVIEEGAVFEGRMTKPADVAVVQAWSLRPSSDAG
jgi:cytoskeletal protein CcmA (bactofilin family)